jgi:hypothetical protein
MKEFKGTPGPWKVDRNNVHTGQIATIHHCIGNDWVEIWSPAWPDSEEAQEANANLIAAAPDLLEALQDIVTYHFGKTATAPAYLKARAAISKALGEE